MDGSNPYVNSGGFAYKDPAKLEVTASDRSMTIADVVCFVVVWIVGIVCIRHRA